MGEMENVPPHKKKKITKKKPENSSKKPSYSLLSQDSLKVINDRLKCFHYEKKDVLLDDINRYDYWSFSQQLMFSKILPVVLRDLFPKNPCSCGEYLKGSERPLPDDVITHFGLNKEHTFWDHYVCIYHESYLLHEVCGENSVFRKEDLARFENSYEMLYKFKLALYGSQIITIKSHACLHVAGDAERCGNFRNAWCAVGERDNRVWKDSPSATYNVVHTKTIHVLEDALFSEILEPLPPEDILFPKPLDQTVSTTFAGLFGLSAGDCQFLGQIDYHSFQVQQNRFIVWLAESSKKCVGRVRAILKVADMVKVVVRKYDHVGRDASSLLPIYTPVSLPLTHLTGFRCINSCRFEHHQLGNASIISNG